MPNRLPLFPPDPRPFCATPAYYTPFPEQPPTRPGWYCCELADGRIKHLTWKCGSFWDGPQEVENVSHWVELPEFVQVILQEVPLTPL